MKGAIAIMRAMQAALAADVELAAYCQAKYQKPLKYYLGVDDTWMPEASNAPMLAMRPGSYAPSADRSRRDVGVVCGIVIEQSGIATGTANTNEMTGLSDLEALYDRVERALMRFIEDPDTFNGQATIGDLTTEIAYPLFRLSWEITFQEDYQ